MAVSTMFEMNDTLQLTKEQGFPEILDIQQHIQTPYTLENIQNKTFSFHDKPRLRNYPVPPVRCFLVQNINDKRIYRGHCYMIEVSHDYKNGTTSGKFTITKIFPPEQMKQAFEIIDSRIEVDYFS